MPVRMMRSSSHQKGEAVERRREVRRRRRWVDEKRQIAEASLQPRGLRCGSFHIAFARARVSVEGLQIPLVCVLCWSAWPDDRAAGSTDLDGGWSH